MTTDRKILELICKDVRLSAEVRRRAKEELEGMKDAISAN